MHAIITLAPLLAKSNAVALPIPTTNHHGYLSYKEQGLIDFVSITNNKVSHFYAHHWDFQNYGPQIHDSSKNKITIQ